MFASKHKGHAHRFAPMDFWISYSDLMAGLVMVFVLLLMGVLLVLRTDAQEKSEALQRQEEAIHEKKDELGRIRTQVKSVLGIREELLARVKARFAQQGSEVEFDDATGAIRLGSDILFEEGSAKLTRRGQETLKTTMPLYFEALLGDPRLGDYVDRISIEGHTNSNYSGSANPRDAYLYNLRLSQGRAYAALDYIIRHQLGGARDVKEVLVANGYSHSRIILNPESGQEDKARSRRIEIRFRLKDEETLRVLEGVLRRGVDTDNSIQVPQ